jgi:hypothetical protein
MSALPGRMVSPSHLRRQPEPLLQQLHEDDDDSGPSSHWYESEQMAWDRNMAEGSISHQPTQSTETETIENQLLELAFSPRTSGDVVSAITASSMTGTGTKSIVGGATVMSVAGARSWGDSEGPYPPISIIQHDDEEYDEDSTQLGNLDSIEVSERRSEGSSLNAEASNQGDRSGMSNISAVDGKSWLNIDSTSTSKGSQGSYADQVPALSGSHSTTHLVLQQPLGQQPLYREPPVTTTPKKHDPGPSFNIIDLVDPDPEDPFVSDVDYRDEDGGIDLGAKSQKSDLDDILGPNGQPIQSDLDDILGPQDGGVHLELSEQCDSLDSTLGPYGADAGIPAQDIDHEAVHIKNSIPFQSEYSSVVSRNEIPPRPPTLAIAPPYSSYVLAEATTRTHATYENTVSIQTPSETRRAITAIHKSLADLDVQSGSVWSANTGAEASILPEASIGADGSILPGGDADMSTTTGFGTACEDNSTILTYSKTPVTSGAEATMSSRTRTQHTNDTNTTHQTPFSPSSHPSTSGRTLELPPAWESKQSEMSPSPSMAERSSVWESSVMESEIRTIGTNHTTKLLSPSTRANTGAMSPNDQSSAWEGSSRGDTLSPGMSTVADRSRTSRTRDFAISTASSTTTDNPHDPLSPGSASAYSQGDTYATSSRGVDTLSHGIDTFSRGDTLSPSTYTRASGTFSSNASGTLSPGESSRANYLLDRCSASDAFSHAESFSPTERSSRVGVFSPTETTSRMGSYTPSGRSTRVDSYSPSGRSSRVDSDSPSGRSSRVGSFSPSGRSSRVGSYSPSGRSSRVGNVTPSESSHGTATQFTYMSEANRTNVSASNLSEASNGHAVGNNLIVTPSRISHAASGASVGVASVHFSNSGQDIGVRTLPMAQLHTQKGGSQLRSPQTQKLAESIMARTRSRADPDAVVGNGSNLGELERPHSMVNLSAQDEGGVIENTALARKRVRVVQLLTIGLAAFLIAFLGGFWVQSSCHFLSATVQVGQNAETFHLRFGLWKYSPIDSVFQGYTYCSHYDGNTAPGPWFGRAASLIGLFGGAFAICVLWIYLVLGRCSRGIWKAAVVSAGISGALQLSTLSMFAGPICQQGECALGPAGVLSIVASCVYFILAFEMHYNTPMVALPEGLASVPSIDQPHNLMANLEMIDFGDGAKAYVHRITFGDKNPYPSLNQYQRQRDNPIVVAPNELGTMTGSYKPPAVIV